MRVSLPSALGSFGQITALEQLQKAERELGRCLNASSEVDLRDAAINCAISLWHINDWVWVSIAQDRNDDLLSKLFGVSDRRVKKDDFIQWSTAKCPELNIVQSICNASKHVATIGVRRSFVINEDLGQNMTFRLAIEADGKQYGAIEVFKAAIAFWQLHAADEESPMY